MGNNGICKLDMVYQPKVNMVNGRIESLEALARFKDAFNNDISTIEVINLVKNIDEMKLLTTAVIKGVINDFNKFDKNYVNIPNISINITSVELEDNLFKSWMEEVFKNAGKYVKNIEFEINERHVIINNSKFKEALKFLHGKGIKVSFDDIGSGFNTINLIEEYNVDFIKIDKKIVELVRVDKRELKKIIDSAHKNNVKVVAEGIEDLKTFEELRNLNCDLGQGYYFYKELSVERILEKKLLESKI